MGVYYLLVVLGMVVLAITNADADQSTCFVCVNQMRCDNDSQCVGVENCELLSNLCIEECVLISRQCLICSLCEENVTNTEEPATTEGKVAAAPDPQELFDSVLFNMNISMVRSARLFLSLAAAIGSNNVTNTSVSKCSKYHGSILSCLFIIDTARHFQCVLDVPFKSLSN